MLSVGRWKIYLPLTLAAGFAAAWLGFRGEREQMEMGGGSPAPLRTQLRRIFVRPTEAAARLNEIRSTSRHAAMTQREEEECWTIIRDFNEEQLKSYLAELPPSDWNHPTSWTLTRMILVRWAQIDPLAAIAETRKPVYIYSNMDLPVLTSWISRDREGALRWAASSKDREINYHAGNLAAQIYVKEDPATAIEQLKTQFPDAMDGLIRTLAQSHGDNEESVREFFGLIQGQADSSNRRYAIDDLARNWTQNHLKQALESQESFGLPPERLAELRSSVLGAVAVVEPKQVLDRLLLGQEPALNAGRTAGVQWDIFSSQPGPATEWAVENNQPEPLEIAVKSLMSRRERTGVDFAPALETLRMQYQAWRQLQPEAANQWLQQQSASGQKALTSAPPDATH